MSKSRWMLLAALTGAGVLGACSTKETTNQTHTETVPVTVATTGVTREAAAPVAVPVAPAIQTQPGPKGSQVALNRAAVTGDVLTISLTFSGGGCCSSFKVDEMSVIDDATSQRLGILKDNAGNVMAAPLGSSGKDVHVNSTTPAVVWAKFPAPPPTSTTVSIAIPEVAPFDAVPITR